MLFQLYPLSLFLENALLGTLHHFLEELLYGVSGLYLLDNDFFEPLLVVTYVGRIYLHLPIPQEADGSYIGLEILSLGLNIHIEIGHVLEDCFKDGKNLVRMN